MERIAETECWDAETLRIARDLQEHGYAVIDFPDPELDRVIDEVISDLDGRYDWDDWRRQSWQSGGSLRIQDAWQFNPNVARIAANQSILALLSRLYGRRAFPFQTLNFPVGTQQATHSDSCHFSSIPERFMCGVWLAFEDTDEGNGALQYYPGSNRLPIYANEHVGECSATSHSPSAPYGSMVRLWESLVEVHGLKLETFRARKGQALIWSANLLHGGGGHLDPARTRWSQVTHYYFDDCVYYTPIMSDPFFGSVYYRDITDIATGKPKPNMYVGHPVPPENIEWARRNLRAHAQPLPPPPGFDPELYLAANPDVRAAGVDPLLHWHEHGQHEGRRLKP